MWRLLDSSYYRNCYACTQESNNTNKKSYQTAPEHLQIFWRSLHHKIQRLPIMRAAQKLFQLQVDSKKTELQQCSNSPCLIDYTCTSPRPQQQWLCYVSAFGCPPETCMYKENRFDRSKGGTILFVSDRYADCWLHGVKDGAPALWSRVLQVGQCESWDVSHSIALMLPC